MHHPHFNIQPYANLVLVIHSIFKNGLLDIVYFKNNLT